jgi:hypothetical protein
MSMLKERLQILIDVEQRERLEREAAARGMSVGALVRNAIDLAYPPSRVRRSTAAAAILEADSMEVPEVDELLRDLEEVRSRRG